MAIFRRNKAKGHLFMPSLFLYVFCMARVVSCVMRIAWACYPESPQLSIAAFIFVSAGVLIMLVVNLTFAQRILRATQPTLGWHPGFARLFQVLYALTVILLITTVVAIVQSHYTLDPRQLRIDLDLELAAMTYFLSLAFLPVILIYLSHVIPRTQLIEKFGSGRWKTKVRILMIGTTLCTLGAAFRTGSQFLHPRRPSEPAWYHSKACFYLFNFTIEVLVVYMYLITRVDQRFYVPNGSRKHGDYSGNNVVSEGSSETSGANNRHSSFSSYARIFDGSSSIYSWGDEKEGSIKAQSDSWSQFSDDKMEYAGASSESPLELPPAVVQSRMRVVPIEEAPYVDIRFLRDNYYQKDYWFSVPPSVALQSFGV
ncbi:uncharacterized protein A1O9_00561 [Exophiala aquamarina CBS 119918]|uniref:DUF7702 domain-containing protein n=1 Tax=Exophiala aquamarina CBS 119918 TaxID=1182545 RepID=A0A072PTB1_9EURO|nr:uncharacterized protein A1O9_00561 [Exophiala aquamarina CBS 119918]KEF62588.1 hypothetical protein A1O9_00561 [Exophiala aquamarina CBS 119918]